MNGNNHYLGQIKKRISNCKKRLDALNDQGYTFSKEIYDDLTSIETKIKRLAFPYRMWSKKRPMFVGIIGVLVIIFALIMIPEIIPQDDGDSDDKADVNEIILTITVDDLEDGMNISSNQTINGIASHSENGSIRVEVKINDGEWEIANGTTEWSYELNIDNLEDGNYTLYFKCVSDDIESEIINRTVIIQTDNNSLRTKPTVEIIQPSFGETVYGIFNINGDATAGTGEIQGVEIRIDNSSWKNANGTTRWQYNFNPNNMERGKYTIEVRSFDNESYSDIVSIDIDIRPIDIPQINNTFGLFIPSKNQLFLPGRTYIYEGLYRQKFKNTNLKEFNSVYTTLKLEYKPSWLSVSLSEEKLVTSPNNKTYTFFIYIQIDDNAPMDTEDTITISFNYQNYLIYHLFEVIPKLDSYPRLVRILKPHIPVDIFISTGIW